MGKEYVKVDENGFPVDNRIFSEEDEIPENYFSSWQYQEERTWWQPVYDFKLGKWIEALSEEEIAKRVIENKNKLTDTEMNAIALMELTTYILGGK